jgi:hypothetical protein
VKQYASIVEYALLVIMAGGALWFLWHRWKVQVGTRKSEV